MPNLCALFFLSCFLLSVSLSPTGRRTPLVSPFLCNGGCIIFAPWPMRNALEWYTKIRETERASERVRRGKGRRRRGEREEGDCPCRVLFVHLLFTKEWACCLLLLCSHCDTRTKKNKKNKGRLTYIHTYIHAHGVDCLCLCCLCSCCLYYCTHRATCRSCSKAQERNKPIEMRQTQREREDRHEERKGVQKEQRQQAKEKKKDTCGCVQTLELGVPLTCFAALYFVFSLNRMTASPPSLLYSFLLVFPCPRLLFFLRSLD